MIIGEAPGANEDKTGEPFVGRAGKLLDNMLAAIDLKREDVYIANVLKCRPPNNRDPLADEVKECTPYLHQQIQSVQPKVLLLVGLVASKYYYGNDKLKMKDIRGRWTRKKPDTCTLRPKAIMSIYHPAAMLRNSRLKIPTWDDLQEIQRYLKEE